MIALLLECLTPTFVGLALLAALLAGVFGAGALRGLGIGIRWSDYRRARALDRELALVRVPRCPACGAVSTWDPSRRCGCWSGR